MFTLLQFLVPLRVLLHSDMLDIEHSFGTSVLSSGPLYAQRPSVQLCILYHANVSQVRRLHLVGRRTGVADWQPCPWICTSLTRKRLRYGVLHCNGHLRKTRKVVELMALASATCRAFVTPPFGVCMAHKHYVPALPIVQHTTAAQYACGNSEA
jgi:hypothetical protein